jgi:hypothetical protein
MYLETAEMAIGKYIPTFRKYIFMVTGKTVFSYKRKGCSVA